MSDRSVYWSVAAVVVLVDRVVDELLVVMAAAVVCPAALPISRVCRIHAAS